MPFTAVEISCPDIPENVDVLRYLTAKPVNKLQEKAQAQARALAQAKKQGLSITDIQRIFPSQKTASQPSADTEITPEMIQAMQEAKDTVFPPQITPEHTFKTPNAYPYLYPNARTLEPTRKRITKQNVPQEILDLENPSLVVSPTTEEYPEPVKYITTLLPKLEATGILKIQMPSRQNCHLKAPLGADITGFKTERQVAVPLDLEFDYNEIRAQFFRVLLHFHEKHNKSIAKLRFPVVNGHALDLFKLFRVVERLDGPAAVSNSKDWVRVTRLMNGNTSGNMRTIYTKYIADFREWLDSAISLKPYLFYHLRLAKDFPNETATENWQSLGDDIYVNKSFDTELKFITIDDDLDDPPLYNMRTFSMKNQFQSAQDVQFPCCWYETERISTKMPCLLRADHLKSKYSGNDHPWDLMNLVFDSRVATKHIEQNIDELLFPKLDYGLAYSSRVKVKPMLNTLELSVLFEGGCREWVAKDGSKVIQYPGEIVIVHWDYAASYLSRDFTASASVNLPLLTQWPQLTLQSSEINEYFSVQKFVYDCLNSTDNYKDELAANGALDVLMQMKHTLRDLEIQTSNAAKDYKSEVLNGTETETCYKCHKKLFFSWFKQEDKVTCFACYSPQTDTVFCKMYTEPNLFFDNWKFKPSTENSDTVLEYLNSLQQLFDKQELVHTEDLRKFIENSPNNQVTQPIIEFLEKLSANLHKNLSSYANHTTPQAPVDCQDGSSILINKLKPLNYNREEYLAQWEAIFAAFCNNQPLQPITFPSANVQISELFSKGSLIDIHQWTINVASMLKTGVTSFKAVERLLYEAKILHIPVNGNPTLQGLINLHQELNSAMQKIDNLFATDSPINGSEILEAFQLVKSVTDFNDERQARRLEAVSKIIGVLANFGNPTVLLRPKLSQVKLFELIIPAARSAIVHLEDWLTAIRMLDWPAIIVKVDDILNARPPQTPKQMKSSDIQALYTEFLKLQVIPDDADQISALMTKTMAVLTNTPPDVLFKYGFI